MPKLSKLSVGPNIKYFLLSPLSHMRCDRYFDMLIDTVLNFLPWRQSELLCQAVHFVSIWKARQELSVRNAFGFKLRF